jgi:hypothetical protein
MHAAILTVLLTIATPDELNGAVVLPAPEFDWDKFHYVMPEPEIERRWQLFERPGKVPSVVRVHRFRK